MYFKEISVFLSEMFGRHLGILKPRKVEEKKKFVFGLQAGGMKGSDCNWIQT